MDRNLRITTLAIFIAMAVALHWGEAFIPRPAPFLRFGFANILTICALYVFGGLWALFVVASRVIIGSILSGSIFSPTFFFSLFGGITAGLIMWAMPKGRFSTIGISIGGALGHMTAQVILASFIIKHASLFHLLPVFFLVSIVTGMINGYCAQIILEVIKAKRVTPHP